MTGATSPPTEAPLPRFLVAVLAFCSAAVAAVLADVTVEAGGRTAPTLHAYLLVFLIAGGAAVLALAVTLCLPRQRRPTTGGVEPDRTASLAQEGA